MSQDKFARYMKDRDELAELCRQIDSAPRNAVPVFKGIAALHDRVRRFERENKIEIGDAHA